MKWTSSRVIAELRECIEDDKQVFAAVSFSNKIMLKQISLGKIDGHFL